MKISTRYAKHGLATLLVITMLLVSSSFALADGSIPKYLFLFIGDGMSFPQVSSTEMYLGNQASQTEIATKRLNFSDFPVTGVAQTFDASSFVPDSASTATSVASGIKTLSGVINMDVTKTTTVSPFTEELKQRGYRVGIISSVPVNHATPAAFYAKVPHRGQYYEIGTQFIQSGFDFLGGGGFLHQKGSTGEQEDLFDVARAHGYTVANTDNEILALNSRSGKVIAINPILEPNGAALNYEIDRGTNELALADFVRKGIDVLDNPQGYVLIVEAGKIDWAGHANDAAASIHDTIAFAAAIEEAIKVYNAHPDDTLILVTGDHECGGMTIGFAGTGYKTFFQVMERVSGSNKAFNVFFNEYKSNSAAVNAQLEHLLPQIRTQYGLVVSDDPSAAMYPEGVLTASEWSRLEAAFAQSMTLRNERNYTDHEKIIYGGYEPLTIALTHIVNNKAGLHYTSFSHTGLPVPVYAKGNGSELFTGFYDNTDIYRKVGKIMRLTNPNVPLMSVQTASN